MKFFLTWGLVLKAFKAKNTVCIFMVAQPAVLHRCVYPEVFSPLLDQILTMSSGGPSSPQAGIATGSWNPGWPPATWNPAAAGAAGPADAAHRAAKRIRQPAAGVVPTTAAASQEELVKMVFRLSDQRDKDQAAWAELASCGLRDAAALARRSTYPAYSRA